MARPASPGDVARAIKAQLAGPGVDREIAEVYRRRGHRPIWAMRPEGLELGEALAARDSRHAALVRQARSVSSADPHGLAQLELRLSRAYTEAVSGARTGRGLAFVDPELAGGAGRGQALATAAKARDLGAHVDRALHARNPIEAGLEAALAEHRRTWGKLPSVAVPAGGELGPGATGPRVGALRARLGLPRAGRFDAELTGRVAAFQHDHGLEPSGRADAETIRALNRGPAYYQRLIAANLERARALPADFGPRYILVDAAAGRLWYFERDRPRLSMKVVVGRPDAQTPMMAGMIRHLIFNPYWNIPPDLVRTSVAPKVLSEGVSYADDLELRPAYDERAPLLDPANLDWRAVQRGQRTIWVRQRPGPKNGMGQVKMMLPNPLGIYLHDTPARELFAQEARAASAGCVRLEDAIDLAELLVGERQVARALRSGRPELRVDLKAPVPVYITYFTAMPTENGMTFRPDIYGRDGRRVANAGGDAPS